MARGFVLTFHSQNIAGNAYANNDHVALDECLTFLRTSRLPILRLLDVVRCLRAGSFATLPDKFVCITFDDGCDFDWHDLRKGEWGVQKSMFAILRKHSVRILGPWWLRKACATSFVIASSEARRDISLTALGDPGLMSDTWWRQAQASGLLDIGTHGWNHVHPAVREMQARPDLMEKFDRLRSIDDAVLQVKDAFHVIHRIAGGESATIFAYPYGQVSDYLADEYLPAQHEILGAVTAEATPLTERSNPWRLPRYICGWNWKSNDDLVAILAGG